MSNRITVVGSTSSQLVALRAAGREWREKLMKQCETEVGYANFPSPLVFRVARRVYRHSSRVGRCASLGSN